MTQPAHLSVLLVEDNRDIAAGIVDYLEARGHVPDSALDGVTGLHLAVTQEYDVVVLDLALPGIDGLTLARRLRADAGKSVPILMLTARDTLEDKLAGFSSGADDYLIKPFSLLELEARLTALGNRGPRRSQHLLQVGDLTLDLDTWQAERAGQHIGLTPTALRLLETLMRASPKLVRRPHTPCPRPLSVWRWKVPIGGDARSSATPRWP